MTGRLSNLGDLEWVVAGRAVIIDLAAAWFWERKRIGRSIAEMCFSHSGGC